MGKITRFTIKEFAKNATSANMGQFGSLAAGSPNYTTDPATIQALAAFLTGWSAETTGDWVPALEDFNSLDFIIFQSLCYFQQMGIPEYDAGTTYYINSFCQVAGVLYKSLVDDNIGNTPASNPSSWKAYDLDDIGDVNDKLSKTIAGEIYAMTEKTTPVAADVIVIEDSADSYSKKKAQIGNIQGIPASKIYDSGWFDASTINTDHSLTHSLGTKKLLIKVYAATDNAGANMSEFNPVYGNLGDKQDTVVSQITTTTCNLRTGGTIGTVWNGSAYATANYIKVIIIALE